MLLQQKLSRDDAIGCCFSALRLSNDPRFTGSGNTTVDSIRRAGSTDGRYRQATRLHLGLGDAGSIRIEPRCHGDVPDTDYDEDSAGPALDVNPDGADADCLVELRACAHCWISLAVVLDRFDESEVASPEHGQFLTSDDVGNKSSAVICRQWLVFYHRVCCISS